MISTTYLSATSVRWTPAALEELLEQSRTSNADVEVTGVLLYSGGSFIQTLEGPEDAVDDVMARVQADPRHTGVEVLRRDEVAARSFAGWSMGFRQLPAERADTIPGFTDYLRNGHVDGATAGRAVETFHRMFRDQMGDPLQPRDQG